MLSGTENLSAQLINENCVQNRTPMQHYIWLKACAETLYPNHELTVICGGDDAPTALGAFARQSSFPGRLFLLGAEELGEPTDLIYQSDADALGLAKAFKKNGRAGRYGHFPAKSPFVAALKTIFAKSGYVATAPIEGSPFIKLDESWRDPLLHFSSRYRSDFRRMQRRAETLGEIKAEILAPTQENVEKLLDEAIAVEAHSWKSRAGTSLSLDERNAKFFRRYAALASEQGILRIAFLRINGVAVAMQIAVECDDGFWLFKIGYNEEFRRCSPGNLLMLQTVKYAAEKGLSTFEFLGKSAPWTKIWTQDERENIRLRVYPYTVHGLVALGLDGTVIGLKRLKEKLSRGSSKPHA